MSRKPTLKQLNRGAIYASVTIWLAIQATQPLEPLGITSVTTRTLVIAALVAIPVVFWWSWPKRPHQIVDDHLKQSSEERQHQILVSFEIVALSAMLISLLVYL